MRRYILSFLSRQPCCIIYESVDKFSSPIGYIKRTWLANDNVICRFEALYTKISVIGINNNRTLRIGDTIDESLFVRLQELITFHSKKEELLEFPCYDIISLAKQYNSRLELFMSTVLERGKLLGTANRELISFDLVDRSLGAFNMFIRIEDMFDCFLIIMGTVNVLKSYRYKKELVEFIGSLVENSIQIEWR